MRWELMVQLLTVGELSDGIDYPAQFIRVVELGLTDLEPWRVIEGEELAALLEGLAERYPTRTLVPFARRIDNDDVACWDIDRAHPGFACSRLRIARLGTAGRVRGFLFLAASGAGGPD